MCECPSTSAGITVLPVKSTRLAPAGGRISPLRPTRVNRLFWTRNAAFSIGGPPSPEMRRAPSKRVAVRNDVGGRCAAEGWNHAPTTTRHATTDDFIESSHPVEDRAPNTVVSGVSREYTIISIAPRCHETSLHAGRVRSKAKRRLGDRRSRHVAKLLVREIGAEPFQLGHEVVVHLTLLCRTEQLRRTALHASA